MAACSSGGNGTAFPSQPNAAGAQTQAPAQIAAKIRSHKFTVVREGPAARVCPDVPAGFAHCHAWRRLDVGQVGPDVRPEHGQPLRKPSPGASQPPPTTPAPLPSAPASSCTNPGSGYTPCDLQAAYNVANSVGGSRQTVGIVDAYDDPNAESDLAVYRSQFALPACTTSSGCFRKLNQSSVKGNYPNANAGWAQEISLDLDMVSAICPNCKILLVEANSSSFGDLAAAVNTAVSSGATVVSNSYSGGESQSTVTSFGPAYSHAGVTITASAGDNGYSSTAQFPDDLNTVVSVGGTTLSSIDPRVESAWNNAGSGCSSLASASTSRPNWQTALANVTGVCPRRAYTDVSAVGDPNTGVDAYDSYQSSGWLLFGGTSVSSPIIASIFALAGNAASAGPAYPYAHSVSLNDITSGSNGHCHSGLCNATDGWDGPTGLGSPNGTSAF